MARFKLMLLALGFFFSAAEGARLGSALVLKSAKSFGDDGLTFPVKRTAREWVAYKKAAAKGAKAAKDGSDADSDTSSDAVSDTSSDVTFEDVLAYVDEHQETVPASPTSVTNPPLWQRFLAWLRSFWGQAPTEEHTVETLEQGTKEKNKVNDQGNSWEKPVEETNSAVSEDVVDDNNIENLKKKLAENEEEERAKTETYNTNAETAIDTAHQDQDQDKGSMYPDGDDSLNDDPVNEGGTFADEPVIEP